MTETRSHDTATAVRNIVVRMTRKVPPQVWAAFGRPSLLRSSLLCFVFLGVVVKEADQESLLFWERGPAFLLGVRQRLCLWLHRGHGPCCWNINGMTPRHTPTNAPEKRGRPLNSKTHPQICQSAPPTQMMRRSGIENSSSTGAASAPTTARCSSGFITHMHPVTH